MLLHIMVSIQLLEIFFCASQNVTVCGNITCSPFVSAHGCSHDGNECRCLRGYKGTACEEDIDECSLAHHPLCGNTGQCENIGGGFKCTCMQGWYGSHCKDRNQSISAGCLPGWTGLKCDTDVNECISGVNGLPPDKLCKNSGTCVNSDGSYACNCATGWQGNDCSFDIDECTTSLPCHRNSSCHNTIGLFSCECPLGWQGQTCSIDVNECVVSQPCGEQSACINSLGSYACACAIGWQGEYCTVDVDECLLNPCGQFRNCTNTIGSFYCNRSSSLTGALRESRLKGQPDLHVNTGLIVGLVIGLIALLWSAVVAIVMIKYRFGKSRRVTDDGKTAQQDIEKNEKSTEVVTT